MVPIIGKGPRLNPGAQASIPPPLNRVIPEVFKIFCRGEGQRELLQFDSQFNAGDKDSRYTGQLYSDTYLHDAFRLAFRLTLIHERGIGCDCRICIHDLSLAWRFIGRITDY